MTRGGMPDFTPLKGLGVLIGLSGGADSVALTSMLCQVREELELTLYAAYLDHGIRPESAEDARWCRELCEGLRVPFFTERIDVPAEAARTGEGLETAARRLRYEWLFRLRDSLGADVIALAHHMDDQAETVLMHLARGTGPEGIGGMAARSGPLVRPLLGLRKRELAGYLRARGLAWREDATNALGDTPRNALRLYAIPELEKTYPQFVRAAARYAESARVESDYVAAQAEAYLKSHLSRGPYGELLEIGEGVHPALLRRAIRALCGGEVGWERLTAAAALAQSARGSADLTGGLRVERGRLGLYFLPGPSPAIPQAPLYARGKSSLPGICEIIAEPAAPVPVRDDPMRQVVDAAALKGAVLRTRRPGDRFRPLGCGDRLLSDYFTDRKLDRPLRDCVALVARGDRVLWACGMGISEDVKLTPKTESAAALTCRYAFDPKPEGAATRPLRPICASQTIKTGGDDHGEGHRQGIAD